MVPFCLYMLIIPKVSQKPCLLPLMKIKMKKEKKKKKALRKKQMNTESFVGNVLISEVGNVPI